MELRRYWQVLRRRWLLIAIPFVLVALFSIITYTPPASGGFNVGVYFIVGQEPAAAAAQEDEERYYNWLASEYIVNGLTDWVTSGRFREAVSAELAEEGLAIPPGSFTVAGENIRSKLLLSVSHGDADNLATIMEAAIRVLQEQNGAALPQLGGETAVLVQLDDIVVTPLPAGLTAQLMLPLQWALGLAAGLGLALVVDYIDPTLRNREEVEALGLGLLGEIPKQK